MFRRIISNNDPGANAGEQGTLSPGLIERADQLFQLHPTELFALLEMAWSYRLKENVKVGDPRNKSGLRSVPDFILQLFDNAWNNRPRFVSDDNSGSVRICRGSVLWDHLIYAYIIESTQLYRIFQKLMDNYARGDFEINLDQAALQWLHNTESLWFCDPPVYSTFNVVSRLRTDIGATRRNAYYRMFGFTLPGDATADGASYPFYQPKASNANYRRNFERFCEETWIGVENDANTSGKKPTDDESIAFHAFEMQKNFASQRNNGDITKQEFYFVSMLSWFHLALEYNSPVIRAFGINEESPAQRLFALANIVGIPANGLSENLFRLADPMSLILTQIETGIYNSAANVGVLYDTDASNNAVSNVMRRIIFNYSQVTGRDLKVRQGENTGSYPLTKGNGIPAATNGYAPAMPN